MSQQRGFKLIVVCQKCGQKNSAFYHLLRKTNCGKCHEHLLQPDKPQGFVYLLKAGEHPKIGKAIDMKKRLNQIKLALPVKPEVIHTIEAFHPYQAEHYWHKRFADKRLNGEWFVLTDRDVAEFKNVSRM